MRYPWTMLFVSMCVAFAGVTANAQSTKPVAIDTAADTWTATDALGRTLPGNEQVGPPRTDKYVGIFYFLWLGQHGTDGPYDITKILAANPGAMTQPANPAWGPMHHYHFWSEPLFGYYQSDDAWVLRKHAQMLSDAGVDVVVFDVTNHVTYSKVYLKLCEVFTAVRRDGGRTPQIAFLCPFWDPKRTAGELYENLYKPGRYSDLWFQWKGKPLLLADREKVSPEIREFFTFRKPQADYFAGPGGPDEWGWLEIYPQHVFRDGQGRPEQMTVGVGQNATGKRLSSFSEKNTYGRSWHNGKKDESPDAVLKGLNFAEQWEGALKVDPEFVFITGWNEWIAMRLNSFNKVHEPVMFVDQYTQEYSRDIEPMKSGHTDNYYYQMISFIRRFKGVRPSLASNGPKTVVIDGNFSDWSDVQPEYRDDLGDTMHRDHPGYDKVVRYVNQTGRNDFVMLKATYDRQNIYFYVRTHKAITPCTDPRWMMLFLDIDEDARTGWQGYDYVVNRQIKDAATTVVEKSGGGWDWKSAGETSCRVKGNELELAISRAALGMDSPARPVRFCFKWADNMQKDDDVMEFLVNGDTAPNGRFAYPFR